MNFSLSSLFCAGFFFVNVAFSHTISMIYKCLHLYVPSIIRTLCPSLSFGHSLSLSYCSFLPLSHAHLSPLSIPPFSSLPPLICLHTLIAHPMRAQKAFSPRNACCHFRIRSPHAARCTLLLHATVRLSTACLHIPVFRCPPSSPLALPAHCRLAHKSFKIK